MIDVRGKRSMVYSSLTLKNFAVYYFVMGTIWRVEREG